MNESPPVPVEGQDRSTGLLIFGILTILLGVFCGLAATISLFSQALVKHDPALGQMRGMGIVVGFYFGLAVLFIWLGIGSINARRWARALLLIIFWGWLAMGVISVGCMIFTLPQMLEATPPPSGQVSPTVFKTMMMVTIGFTSVIFVVIPAIGVFFYSGKKVKSTCELKDPVVRWTDRCPLPVLAASLWMALGAAGMLLACFSGMAVLPFFGDFVTGVPAVVLCLAIFVVWAWAAWAMYKLDVRSLWIAVAFTVLFSISSILTYSRHGLAEMYRLAGYPPAQVALMEKSAIPEWFMTWGTLIWVVPVIAYLLYLRRYFRRV